MPSINNLLTKWKLWINRDSTFKKDELKELQSHLMEEINFLVNREGLNEEEAFHKAVSLVGEREGLDQEYVKVKSAPGKLIHWAKVNPWSWITLVLVLMFTLGYFLGWYPVQKEVSKLNNQLYIINTNKKSYKPFTLIENSIEPINKPKIGWETEFDSVNYYPETLDGLATPPVLDDEGNIYFIQARRQSLYSLSPTGKIRWKKELDKHGFYKLQILVVKNGILVISSNGLEYIGKNGEVVWIKEGTMQDGPFLRSDGLVILCQMKSASSNNNEKEGIYEIEAVDATGNTVWQYAIQDSKNSYIVLKTCFFDTELNGYFLFQIVDNKRYEKDFKGSGYSYYIYKISRYGDFEWQKLVPNEDKLNQWSLPSGNLKKDVFILTFWQNYPKSFNDIEYKKMATAPKEIIAFNTQGEEVWKVTEKSYGSFREFYAIDNDSYFYTIYKSDKKSFLKIYSETGLPWEVELKGDAITPIKLDHDDNIYLGLQVGLKQYIYSYFSTGIFRWSIEIGDIKDFTLGPNKNIYYYNWHHNKVYSIQEEIK